MIDLVPAAPARIDDALARHSEPMLRAARRILASEDLAWDAVQESLLALWALESLPPNPRAWLLRAVVHRSLHLRRGLLRRQRREQEAGGACPMCAPADPLRVLAGAEAAAAVAEALGALSPAQREVLLLFAFERLEYEGIASRLQVPVGTVRSRLSRAREALRTRLAAEPLRAAVA